MKFSVSHLISNKFHQTFLVEMNEFELLPTGIYVPEQIVENFILAVNEVPYDVIQWVVLCSDVLLQE